MLVYIQGARIVSMARETAISRLKGWLIGRLWFGVALAVVFLLLLNAVPAWTFEGHAALLSALVLIILASRAGAIVSIGRRMTDDNLGVGVNGDSIFTLASLGSGRNGLALALLTSNVFGLVVTALFASGLPATLGLVGGIAPVFSDVAVNVIREKADHDTIKASDLRMKVDELQASCRIAPTAASGGLPNPVTDAAPPASGGTQPARTAPGAQKDARGETPPQSVMPSPDRPGSSSHPGTTQKPDTPGETAPPTSGNAPTAATTVATACSAAALKAAETQAEATEAMAKESRLAVVEFARLTPAGGSAEDKWFAGLAASLGLATVPDLFKLLVWAFIAGFFEQLVPDMLDTLAARAKDSKLKEDAVQR